MNLYVETLFKCIRQQLELPENASAPLLFMVPDISGSDAVALRAACENLSIAGGRHFEIHASRECMAAPSWSEDDRRVFFQDGDELSLTHFRNTQSGGNSFTVLLGTAAAEDRGSLKDFYTCDQETLFRQVMRKSFRTWAFAFLEEGSVSVPQSAERIRDWDKTWGRAWNDILGALRDSSSLAEVSRLLASIPATEGAGEEDARLAAVLRNLPGLPDFSGFVEYARNPKKHHTFRFYEEQARDFVNYHGAYLDEGRKKKMLDAIGNFRSDSLRTEIDPSPFATEDVLLDALDSYIRTHDTTDLGNLKRADFVMIVDKILGAKPHREPSIRESRDSLKKLSGSPVESLLMGAWVALGRFRQSFENEDGSFVVPEKIEFRGFVYKYRREGTANAAEAREDAKMIFGGLDDLLKDHLEGLVFDEGRGVEIDADLLPDNLQAKNAGQSEPSFEFHVTVRGGGNSLRARFALLLPDVHAYRLASGLLLRAKMAMDVAGRGRAGRDSLPVFHLPYYSELLRSRDEEETSYVMDAALKADVDAGSFLTYLFTEDWRDVSTAAPLAEDIDAIDRAFRAFLDDVAENGLHAAIGRLNIPFVDAYRKALDDYIQDSPAAGGASKAAAMLMRAFLFVAEHERQGASQAWKTAEFEPSALVTVLHPALIEMLQAQWTFLFDAFVSAAADSYKSDEDNPFREGRWTYYEDLAEIKYPLTGLPVRQGGAYELTSPGAGLVFCIGSLPPGDALVSTQFLTRDDAGEDDEEEIAASELFRETSESRLLRDRLDDYAKMHPESDDGLSLAIFRNEDIQPVLSGLDAFLRSRRRKADDVGKFVLCLSVFSESSDTSVVSRWLSAWQDYIESDDGEDAPYPGCEITVSHRLVSPGAEGCEAFARVIREEVDADVFVLYDFIRPDGNGCRFEEVGRYDRTARSFKFPVLEQAQAARCDPDELYHRAQIVSNRQFVVSDGHANLSHRLVGHLGQGIHSVVLADGDYTPWQCVIDAAHEAAEWVVAIDPLVDRKLIGRPADDVTGPSRELIGFGTGVGQHGESNFTVSTQQTDLHGLAEHLKNTMRQEVFRFGTSESDDRIARYLLQESRELSGLSIVRAVGPGQYVRDFLAYALLRRMLPTNEQGHDCNRLFSIDAYRHWFDIASGEDRTHPDLLWLVADIDPQTERFQLKARLIECKMGAARQMDTYLDHAFDQIKNGLKVLSRTFSPRGAHENLPPDARYWYLQLHRLIANGVSDVPPDRMPVFLRAMECLADGDFSIEWEAAIYSFLTDDIGDASLRRLDRGEDCGVCHVNAYQCGYPFIDMLCRDASPIGRAWDTELLTDGDAQMPTYEPRPGFVDTDDLPPVAELSSHIEFTNGIDTSPDRVTEDCPPAPEPELNPVPAGLAPVEPASAPATPVSEPEPAAPAVTVVAPAVTGAVPERPAQSVPDRILLGKTDSGGGREICWEFGHPELANRHLLIFGSSGQGKTYAIQALLCELGKKGQHSLILDYTEGFKTSQLERETVNSLRPEQHIVRNSPLPIDPFAFYSQDDGGIVIRDRPVDVAKRVASIFKSVYSDIGSIQYSVLVDAIKAGLAEQGGLTLDGLRGILDAMAEEGGRTRGSVESLRQKIGGFADDNPFSTVGSTIGWEVLFADPDHLCHVFQLTGLDRISRRTIVEFVLWDLYAHVRAHGRKDRPKVLVLDEVQNLSQDADAPLSNYLAEARKFGISLIMATQSVSNASSQEFKDKLFLASQLLLFQPPAGSAKEYAKIICDRLGGGESTDEWKRRLMNLARGECYAVGPAYDPRTNRLRPSSVERIRITSLHDRGF